MKYTKEQRLQIGKRIYEGEISRFEAAEKYGIGSDTAREYMRLYRDTNQLPPKRADHNARARIQQRQDQIPLEKLQDMSREQLLQELLRAGIASDDSKAGSMRL